MKYMRALLAVVALAFVGAVQAAPLSGEYSVTASATNISGNQWQFDYSVTNLTQGTPGSYLGFDGFALFIPETATVVSVTTPAPYTGAPGYWGFTDLGTSPAFSGYTVGQWWGYNVESVYEVGSTATFSIVLDNVSVGTNAYALTTYWGFTSPTASEYWTNPYGNYTTYLTTLVAPVAAVPEPESFAMLLIGLTLIGLMARRRKSL